MKIFAKMAILAKKHARPLTFGCAGYKIEQGRQVRMKTWHVTDHISPHLSVYEFDHKTKVTNVLFGPIYCDGAGNNKSLLKEICRQHNEITEKEESVL